MFAGRNRERRRQAARELRREGRPREHGEVAALAEHVAHDLVRQLARIELQTLRGPAHTIGAFARGLHGLQGLAQRVAGHDHEHLVGARERLVEICHGFDLVG